MKFKKILLYYKESAYKNYFLNKRSSLRKHIRSIPSTNVARFKTVHKVHYETLKGVEEFLKDSNVSYKRNNRGTSIDFSKFDLVITIGGDGTFLDAARRIKRQYILGVNSAPPWSVGKFCRANGKSFPHVFRKILNGQLRARPIMRLAIKSKLKIPSFDVLNDVLVAHANPAAMSRYVIKVGQQEEEQRSSGIWIATAAGSSGALRSAGGKTLPIFYKKFEYKPRELFQGFKKNYALTGGVVNGKMTIKVTSLMREGMIFIDGARTRQPFPLGQSIILKRSANDLNVLGYK